MNNKGIIFDRDGTLIEHIHYLGDPKKVRLISPIKEILTKMKKKGFLFFLQTNQSGVERGFYSKKDVSDCNLRMIELINLENFFTEICISYEVNPDLCLKRKPNPNFGLSLLKKYKISKRDLYFIGDNNVDIDTALNINCNAIHVNSGKVKKESIKNNKVLFFDNVKLALTHINKFY